MDYYPLFFVYLHFISFKARWKENVGEHAEKASFEERLSIIYALLPLRSRKLRENHFQNIITIRTTVGSIEGLKRRGEL